MGRTQSPSSINMYKQCPRRYYYRYIERLPTSPSIHLVRGTVVHEVLEHFFSEPIHPVGDWRTNLQFHGLRLLKRFWTEHDEEFGSLDLTPEELAAYKDETRLMVVNWLKHFAGRVERLMEGGASFTEAFETLTPAREVEYRCDELNVRGFIDAVEERDEGVLLLDYKTSKKNEITPEYRLQLAIYALLYLKRHQSVPRQVGIHFLRHDQQLMEVNDELLLEAQFEIEQIHMLTQSTDKTDYPKREGPLCNWCDYYDLCFKK